MNSFPIHAEQVIPQKAPIVLINQVLQCDDEKTITDYYIADNSIFTENNELQAVGLMENIAQSCAARTGLRRQMGTDGNPVKIGVIGAVKNFIVHKLPSVGTTITTTVTEVADLYPALMVTAEVYDDSQLLASAEMKVFIIDQN